jgi:hypothetical protein
MKKLLAVFVAVIFTIALVQCGGNGSTGAENKYLGKLPGIAASYVAEYDELKADKKKVSDLNDALELKQKEDKLDEESVKAIEDEIKNLKLPVSIPFEGEVNTAEYELKEVKITGAKYNQVEFTATILPKKTGEYLFGYVRLTDAAGKLIAPPKDWCVFAVNNMYNKNDGQQIEMKGYFRGLEKLGNLEKLVFKTREEYEKTK